MSSELDAYDYELPEHLIAQAPLAERSDARLLVVRRATQSLEHRYVGELPEILEAGDCLAINDTRVVPARLVGHRTSTAGAWEGLFVKLEADGCWRLLGKTRGTLRRGESITLHNRLGEHDVVLRLVEKLDDGLWLVRPESDEPTFELLERIGRVPLPPYIRGGKMVDEDRERYQTVFARHPGAVAAPTAGLHFTGELLNRTIDAGLEIARLTLHVGLDTFRPIKVDQISQHRMHFETGSIEPAAVEQARRARQAGHRLVAVGTTAVRVLETAAASGELQPWSGRTDLFIRPPYEFRCVDALLTNFHLPKTTLLVLVRTFGGDALLRHAYQEAIARRYRFYSYGDAMLIL